MTDAQVATSEMASVPTVGAPGEHLSETSVGTEFQAKHHSDSSFSLAGTDIVAMTTGDGHQHAAAAEDITREPLDERPDSMVQVTAPDTYEDTYALSSQPPALTDHSAEIDLPKQSLSPLLTAIADCEAAPRISEALSHILPIDIQSTATLSPPLETDRRAHPSVNYHELTLQQADDVAAEEGADADDVHVQQETGQKENGVESHDEDDEDDDDDDVALLISRELSSDSLEELASRFECPSRLLALDDADLDTESIHQAGLLASTQQKISETTTKDVTVVHTERIPATLETSEDETREPDDEEGEVTTTTTAMMLGHEEEFGESAIMDTRRFSMPSYDESGEETMGVGGDDHDRTSTGTFRGTSDIIERAVPVEGQVTPTKPLRQQPHWRSAAREAEEENIDPRSLTDGRQQYESADTHDDLSNNILTMSLKAPRTMRSGARTSSADEGTPRVKGSPLAPSPYANSSQQ